MLCHVGACLGCEGSGFCAKMRDVYVCCVLCHVRACCGHEGFGGVVLSHVWCACGGVGQRVGGAKVWGVRLKLRVVGVRCVLCHARACFVRVFGGVCAKVYIVCAVRVFCVLCHVGVCWGCHIVGMLVPSCVLCHVKTCAQSFWGVCGKLGVVRVSCWGVWNMQRFGSLCQVACCVCVLCVVSCQSVLWVCFWGVRAKLCAVCARCVCCVMSRRVVCTKFWGCLCEVVCCVCSACVVCVVPCWSVLWGCLCQVACCVRVMCCAVSECDPGVMFWGCWCHVVCFVRVLCHVGASGVQRLGILCQFACCAMSERVVGTTF